MQISSAQVDLIRGWFAHIEQLATDRTTINNHVMSDAETLSEIRCIARECQEYMKRNIT